VAGSLGAGILAITESGPTIPGAGIAPAAFVVSSTQATLAQRTADIVFSGSISEDGHNIPMNGTGETDFSDNAFTGTVTSDIAGKSLVERELSLGNHFYMGMTIDGTNLSELTGGQDWIDIPLPSSGLNNSPGFGSVDPLTQLQALEKKGATVMSLGTSVIDGDPVSEYSVTPSRLEELANMESLIASGQITQAEAKQVLNEAARLGTFTSNVWFDASGLLRRQSVRISGGSSGVTGTVNMTFENFGTPVTIAAPAPSDIVSFKQFNSDIQALQSSQN
jgi:hypothetical protein